MCVSDSRVTVGSLVLYCLTYAAAFPIQGWLPPICLFKFTNEKCMAQYVDSLCASFPLLLSQQRHVSTSSFIHNLACSQMQAAFPFSSQTPPPNEHPILAQNCCHPPLSVIRYGLIRDAPLFAWLEANMDKLMARDTVATAYAIERSCINKAEVREGLKGALHMLMTHFVFT